MRSTEVNAEIWRRSSYSTGNENCVEVAFPSDSVAVRDSKDPDGPELRLSPAAFGRFLKSLR
jgi:hypothetical protein